MVTPCGVGDQAMAARSASVSRPSPPCAQFIAPLIVTAPQFSDGLCRALIDFLQLRLEQRRKTRGEILLGDLRLARASRSSCS